jgi:hypothetical protein
MGFDFRKKKGAELPDEQMKWNKMWDLWAEVQAESPYNELMTYQSEINNGGHDQFFTNIENTGDLHKTLEELKTVLPAELYHNLQIAYKAYLALEEKASDGRAEAILEQCDNTFFENEEKINSILKVYANGITP